MALTEVSIDKYLNSITKIETNIGKLDSLRVILKSSYNDINSIIILENVIEDLTNIIGVKYNMIDLSLMKFNNKEYTKLLEEKSEIANNLEFAKNENESLRQQIAELKNSINILQIQRDTQSIAEQKEQNILKNISIEDIQEEAKTQKPQKKAKKENVVTGNIGAELDCNTNSYVYTFVNSNTLSFASYNDNEKSMIIEFTKNGRIYKYLNMPKYHFDNLVALDMANQSAGKYFQSDIVKEWKKGQYKEITNEEFIF